MDVERVTDRTAQIRSGISEADRQLQVAVILYEADPLSSGHIGIALAQQSGKGSVPETHREESAMGDSEGLQVVEIYIRVDIGILLADSDYRRRQQVGLFSA